MGARKLGIAILVLIGLITASFVVAEMKDGLDVGNADAEPLGGNTLYVGGSGPNNYTSIQAAIDDASDGDTIFVYSGIYYENVLVYKSINLIGEDENTTIIDSGGSGSVVNVTADHVTVYGFTVQNGSGWLNKGIKLDGVQHCRIERVTASNNWEGITLGHSSNCSIINTAVSNNHNGIGLDYSSNCSIINTAVSNSLYGITLWGSISCSITNTIASNNTYGIYLWKSPNCTILNTMMASNSIMIRGDDIAYWNTHTIDTSNTVNGKPVYYWKNVNGGTVPSGAGQIILANCTDVKIENQNVSNGSVGIEIGFSSYCSIINCTVSNNNEYGIELLHSTNCSITNTTVNNNNYGITLDYSTNCIVTNTTVSNNYWSGIVLSSSNNNTIYNNCFNNYVKNAYDDGNNIWNISKTPGTNIIGGPYIGGNYWSDYTGVDTDGDGLGDTNLPYNSNGNITNCGDFAPLVDDGPPKTTRIIPQKGYLYLFGRAIMPPILGQTIVIGKIDVTYEGTDATGIEMVEFYVDGKLMHTAESAPFVWTWDDFAIGYHILKLVATDRLGHSTTERITVLRFNL